MILTGPEIQRQVELGKIQISPFRPEQVNPASYDLRLGQEVLVYEPTTLSERRYGDSIFGLDAKVENLTLKRSIPDEGIWLEPGTLYLMHTVEVVGTREFVTVIDGKALALDTEIPTPNGWTSMGSLAVGDFVFGSDGNPTRVVRATEVLHNRECFEVQFRDRTSIVADASHQWFVLPVDGKPGVRTTGQLATIQRPGRRQCLFHVPASLIRGAEKILPIHPYTLGVWLGDGTSSASTITIRHGDEEILRGIEQEGYPIQNRTSQERGASRYIIDRRPHVHAANGCWTDNGSFTNLLKTNRLLENKHIPEEYKRASYRQRWALLQGLMDTDGTVHRDDQASITLTVEKLARDVEDLFRSLGIVTYWDERPAKINGRIVGTAYRLTFRAAPEMFRIPRQRDKVRTTAKWLESARNPLRGIRNIIPVPSVPVRCIEVENSDGLFMASRSYILTHNSSIGRLGIVCHLTAGYGDPGFFGQYTLEVSVIHPVRVYAGMRFCQARFQTVQGELAQYEGNYVGETARGPVASRSWRQFK